LDIKNYIQKQPLLIDGAMGTQIQNLQIPSSAWEGNEGCNELLNKTFSSGIKSIYETYAKSGANIITTNTFGAIPWVLDDYGLGGDTYDLCFEGTKLAKEVANELSTKEQPIFVAGNLGPGTKLPSLGHISYDEMYEGYKVAAKGLIDGGCDLFLLETCQDPLQIKAAIHACTDAQDERTKEEENGSFLNPEPLTLNPIPIMVSVTIELSGTMLIGTSAKTIATILEPFDILSLGLNCGSGPDQVIQHLKDLSLVWGRAISVHANAGLPVNVGGKTVYPMSDSEFAKKSAAFLDIPGVSFVGGCCGTTPEHIEALAKEVKNKKLLAPSGNHPKSIASLFETKALVQQPAPFLIGERSNATGSKAFRELLKANDYDGTLSVANQQVRSGAHGIDLSVGFAGRDESDDMNKLSLLYSQKVLLPLMIDSTQTSAIEIALKNVGGKPIINSVNLEDGEEKFDTVCSLAKKFGASLVCLTIDEKGMAKTKQQKLDIAKRIYELATTRHNINEEDLVFDLLTFTVGSGDEEYFTAAVETIEAIKEFHTMYPKVGFVLGVSNISFGLDKNAREYLNSVFLYHCVKAGLSMAIVNVKNTLPMHKISPEDKEICENLLFNKREQKGDVLMNFINHFKDTSIQKDDSSIYDSLTTDKKIHKLLVDGEKELMLKLLETAKDEIEAQTIVNEILINAMKEVGQLFGSGQMQLPFVLQSAEVMKASVDFLNPYLPKKEGETTQTTIILGTVKGDVHDVGKNLVDIILTNNGFKVINIGIKAELDEFIKAYKEHNAQALGMSGLLVKSTAIMKENLERLNEEGIDIPILLGGAALNDAFVDEYCRPNYGGDIFYCKDAFDGVEAMGRVQKGGKLDTNLSKSNNDEVAKRREARLAKKEEKKTLSSEEIAKNLVLPSDDIVRPVPPFWGRKVFSLDVKELAHDWINHNILFSQRWGYSKKGLSSDEKEKQTTKLWKTFDDIKKQVIQENIFKPVVLYGYFPCRKDGDDLLIFDESEAFFSEDERNKEPLEKVRSRAKYILKFPRSNTPPHRCISDFFSSKAHDVVAFSLVSSGNEFSVRESKLYQHAQYNTYNIMHGLGVELAEALAEIIHKQVRIELNAINQKEQPNLRDVCMKSYQGCRYSFGYPACPDLSMNKEIFELLKPEEFGIVLGETYQMHPEQTTSALISYHEEAKYFGI
jgi:5-methyltetrahydrofolate--homocysteine methyltransferase